MKKFFHYIMFITVSGIGGLFLSLTGLPIGWMIGTLLIATFLSIFRLKFLSVSHQDNVIPKYWLYLGQCLLGIELGQKVNSSVFYVFLENWPSITIMLLLSIFFSFLSGIILWKYSKLDMLSSFFATAPGGLSSIPGIAEEVGANTGVVSMIQAMRVFLVILTIPVIISFLTHSGLHLNGSVNVTEPTTFEISHLIMTVVYVFIAWIGYYIGKLLKFPAPWLIGSMISVAMIKSFGSMVIGYDLMAWWPHTFIILSQIFIGASIGSRFHKKMFVGIYKALFVSFLSITGLIVFMFICAYFVSTMTDISFITACLAFAPGGIAEMTTTALVLHADATFVVAVQVLRVITVCITLPPFFRFLKYMEIKKKQQSHVSF